MRCVSKGRRVRLRSASTTGGPKVMLGTKRPSMMSTWTQSAPLSSMTRRPPARSAKSAERMLGATRRVMARHGGAPRKALSEVEDVERGLGVGPFVGHEALAGVEHEEARVGEAPGEVAGVAGGDRQGRLEGHCPSNRLVALRPAVSSPGPFVAWNWNSALGAGRRGGGLLEVGELGEPVLLEVAFQRNLHGVADALPLEDLQGV